MIEGRTKISWWKPAALLILGVTTVGAGHAAAVPCESLASRKLPDTTITAAQSIPAGTYTAPNGEVFKNMPAFCRLAATLAPTGDSEIGIEVWMPALGWKGKLEGVGK